MLKSEAVVTAIQAASPPVHRSEQIALRPSQITGTEALAAVS